jgi:formate hydrogenlyase subunit 3/multisubunit Na+/H+ antiporter MnhD subunit
VWPNWRVAFSQVLFAMAASGPGEGHLNPGGAGLVGRWGWGPLVMSLTTALVGLATVYLALKWTEGENEQGAYLSCGGPQA